jgi:hypothetical protein
VILDTEKGTMHYIDLHRSKSSDYVQDVSVFLLSNFRMPMLSGDIRNRINWLNQEFFNFAKDYAKKHDDDTFQARLALGLVRSFITSTRFDLNNGFAKIMYINAVYLLEKLTHFQEPLNEFVIPEGIIVYEGI